MDIMSDDSSKSFHTANEGTDDADPPATPSPTHRRVQRIPYELRDHIRVFLEERMYAEAVQLLTSLLAAGGSNQKYGAQPARVSPLWIPPPSHLAVLATLAVHPAYTSRPQDGNDLTVAGHALQYLRHILTAAGPVQAGMASAFQFRDAQGRPLRAARDKSAKKSNGDTALSRRNSGRSVRSERNSARNSLGGAAYSNPATTNSATAPASRSESTRPRRRLFPQSRSSGGGISSEYVDSGSISYDDDADGSYTGDALVDAVHAAADKMAVDDHGDSNHVSAAFTEEDDEAVGGRMATKDSVWVRAQDFWHITAWVMACSVNEPARWRCWQPWLALVVDVLEADFAERLESGDDSLSDSLLLQYLGSAGSTQLRRIVQAVLADGTQPPSLVREVFDKETVSAAPQSAAALAAQAANPKRKLDLDNNKFGDYSDDDESAPPTPDSARSLSPTPFSRGGEKPKKQKVSSSSKSDGLDSNTGFLESIAVRQRLLHLVMLASVYLPTEFATTDSVYRSIAEVLRDSDIFVFSAVVSAPLPAVHDALSSLTQVPTPHDTFAGLLQHILFTYLPATAPKPVSVDPASCRLSRPSAATSLTSRVLERCCLPFAANTAMLGANLRMALTVESLFSIAWGVADDQGSLSLWTPELQAAAEDGVKAREARVVPAGKGRGTKNPTSNAEALGKAMLQRSGKRLLAMVQLAAMDAE